MNRKMHFAKARIVKNEGEFENETEFGEEVTVELGQIGNPIELYAEHVIGLIDEDDCDDCDCDDADLNDYSDYEILDEVKTRGLSNIQKRTDIVSASIIDKLMDNLDIISNKDLEELLDKYNL